jgi:tetratricopeptide (TPR) repeat protein
LRGPDEAAAAARLEALTDELRAAHRWARASEPALAARLSAALYIFAQTRLRDEPLAWAVELATGTAAGPPHPMVLTSAALRWYLAGDLAAALGDARRAVTAAEEAGDPVARVHAFDALSDVLLFSGRLEDSAAAARRAVVEAEATGDARGTVNGYVNQAITAAYAGRFDQAEDAWRRLRDADPAAPSDQGWVAYTEGEIVLDRDPARALDALDRAIALADSVGNRFLGGVARVSACSLRARVGDPGEAQVAFAEVVEYWRRRGARLQLVTTLRNLVVLLERLGSPGEAAMLLGAVEANATSAAFGAEAARLEELRPAWPPASVPGRSGAASPPVPRGPSTRRRWLLSGGSVRRPRRRRQRSGGAGPPPRAQPGGRWPRRPSAGPGEPPAGGRRRSTPAG